MWRILIKAVILGMIITYWDPESKYIDITWKIISSQLEQIMLYTEEFLNHFNAILEEDPLPSMKERLEEMYLLRVKGQEYLNTRQELYDEAYKDVVRYGSHSLMAIWAEYHPEAQHQQVASAIEALKKEENDLQTLVEATDDAKKRLFLFAKGVFHWSAILLAFSLILSFTLLGIFKCVRPRFYIGPIFTLIVSTIMYLTINRDRPKDFLDYIDYINVPDDGSGERVSKKIEFYLPCDIKPLVENFYFPWLTRHFVLWIYMVLEALFEFFEWSYLRMIQQPQEDMVDLRLKSKNALDLEKLFNYCTQGDKVKVRDAIRKYGQSIDINALRNGSTLLHVAVKGGHKDILEILLKRYKDVVDGSIKNNDGHTALDTAILRKNPDIINLVLDVTKPDIHSLILAVKSNQEKTIRKISSLIEEQVEQKSDLERLCSLLEEMKDRKIKKERKDQVKRNIQIFKQVILESLEENKPSITSDANIRLEFECPICCDEMNPPLEIFACSNDHFLCSECLGNAGIQSCPICREDFSQSKPTRRHAAERIRQSLLNSNT